MCCLDYCGMVRQAKIIIGAHIENFPTADLDSGRLRALDDTLVLEKPGLADIIQSTFQMFLNFAVHNFLSHLSRLNLEIAPIENNLP